MHCFFFLPIIRCALSLQLQHLIEEGQQSMIKWGFGSRFDLAPKEKIDVSLHFDSHVFVSCFGSFVVVSCLVVCLVLFGGGGVAACLPDHTRWRGRAVRTWSAKENDQLSQNFEAQDVNSSVQTTRTNVPAAGDRLRVHHQRFEELSHEIQIAKAFESAGFMRPKEADSLVQTQERNDEAVGNRFKSLTNWRKRFNSRGFMRSLCWDALQRHSRCEMMVFKARPLCAENTRHLVKIPRSLYGSKDTPNLDQFFKFKLDVVLTSLESKFGFLPHWETVEKPGWLYPEAQSAEWTSYIKVIQITLPGSLE